METTRPAIYFRLPKDLDLKLRKLAHREDRTLAAQIRHLIRLATGGDDTPPAAGGSALRPA